MHGHSLAVNCPNDKLLAVKALYTGTLACLFLWAVGLSAQQSAPPQIQREFRGLWVATVFNIDWPSQRGLSTESQKNELLKILDLAKELNFNAVLLQVRPAGDAFYASPSEAWSEFLTGELGKAPDPFFDPLQFAIDEAHKRCLELHAWLNPFRAGFVRLKNSDSPYHIKSKHPELVVQYGKHWWLEPGKSETQDYVVGVVKDILTRYDVDGIHFDDYFYPYWERDSSGQVIEFDDEESFMQYIGRGGRKRRDEWRRENVNNLIQRCYSSIKEQKPWVKFGLSPYGIWRPGFPSTVRGGRDMFVEIYCDSRQWFSNGWLDYFAPQLYWKTTTQPNYQDLLNWWTEQNSKGRHLWPGISDSSIGEWRAEEIVDEVVLTRKQIGSSGTIHYSAKPLLQNRAGICDMLRRQVYSQPALIPSSPWLSRSTPEKPIIVCHRKSQELNVSWSCSSEIWLWAIQQRVGTEWQTEVRPRQERTKAIILGMNSSPDEIAVSAIDR